VFSGRIHIKHPIFPLFLALAEHGRGHVEESRRWLKEATDMLDGPMPNDAKQKYSDTLGWTERVEVNQLRREVEELLKDKEPRERRP